MVFEKCRFIVRKIVQFLVVGLVFFAIGFSSAIFLGALAFGSARLAVRHGLPFPLAILIQLQRAKGRKWNATR